MDAKRSTKTSALEDQAAQPGGHLDSPPFSVRRFTVDEYHRIGEAGILGEEDEVELLSGWISPKMIRGPLHDAVVAQVQRAIGSRMPLGCHLRIQSAITTRDSEPEPDIALVRGEAFDFADQHPEPSDVMLVIEVADSSLARDRAKSHIYASAGILLYWIVDVGTPIVEVCESPVPERSEYARRFLARKGDSLQLPEGSDRIFVDELLPPRPRL